MRPNAPECARMRPNAPDAPGVARCARDVQSGATADRGAALSQTLPRIEPLALRQVTRGADRFAAHFCGDLVDQAVALGCNVVLVDRFKILLTRKDESLRPQR